MAVRRLARLAAAAVVLSVRGTADLDVNKAIAGVEKVAKDVIVAETSSPNAASAANAVTKVVAEEVQSVAAVAPAKEDTKVETAKPVIIDKNATTEAVVKAVVVAESKAEDKAEKKAEAAADATVNVLKAESAVPQAVSKQVLEKAKEDAKETFEKLDSAKQSPNVAADAAAKVAVAEIEGAAKTEVSKDVKVNAEKAAVAAGVGVADHPDSLPGALSKAAEVEKKEETEGKVDLAEKKEGLVAKAGDTVVAAGETVAEIPAAVEGAVENAEAAHGQSFLCLLFMVPVAFLVLKNDTVRAKLGMSASLKSSLLNQGQPANAMISGGSFMRSKAADDCELTFTKYDNFA